MRSLHAFDFECIWNQNQNWFFILLMNRKVNYNIISYSESNYFLPLLFILLCTSLISSTFIELLLHLSDIPKSQPTLPLPNASILHRMPIQSNSNTNGVNPHWISINNHHIHIRSTKLFVFPITWRNHNL